MQSSKIIKFLYVIFIPSAFRFEFCQKRIFKLKAFNLNLLFCIKKNWG